MLIWPRTSSPLLLLTNRRNGSRAQFGKIRLSAGPSRLPRAFSPSDPPPERLLAGYLNRPLFTSDFSASESLDPFTGRSLTDWQTFYEGGTRLADYLNSVGYNGVMLNVFSEGSTIYPSKLLEPTPRWDTGAFFDHGQDPSRKDVLELLLRLFDREHLKLIPTLQFATPLPELEALLRTGGRESDGIQLIGPAGSPWTDVQPSHHGMEPYYNPLDERVQRAMLAVVHELVDRYGKHSSLAGLGVELSVHGYMQLPGDLWGLDDQTIHRFEQRHASQRRRRWAASDSPIGPQFVSGAGAGRNGRHGGAACWPISIAASAKSYLRCAPMRSFIWPPPTCSKCPTSNANCAPVCRRAGKLPKCWPASASVRVCTTAIHKSCCSARIKFSRRARSSPRPSISRQIARQNGTA